MPDSPVVDAHVHLVPGSELGDPERDPYEIWEYGTKPDVEVLELPGTLEQATAAMRAAHCDHFVVVNMFVPDLELSKLEREWAEAGDGSPGLPRRRGSVHDDREQLERRLVDFNSWALEVARQRGDLSVFVAADPSVLPGAAGAAHLRWAVERGARGIKLHTVLQRFAPDDPRMTAVLDTCEELGVAVIAHAGASRDEHGYAEPDAFAPVVERHPRLKLVLAHLGGRAGIRSAGSPRPFPRCDSTSARSLPGRGRRTPPPATSWGA